MKKGEDFKVTVAFRTSFSAAEHRVMIGGTSCNLPASALSYEGAISWIEIKLKGVSNAQQLS